MDIKIVQYVLDVFDQYGEAIRFDLERFEETLNDYAKDLLDECYLVILGFKLGLFDAMIFDEDVDVYSYVQYLREVQYLKKDDAVFLASVLETILENVGYYFEIPDIDSLIKDAYQRHDFFQLSLIGRAYLRGFGVSQDYEKAFEINSYLHSQGYESVAYDLGIMYEYGFGIEKNIEKAFMYYQSREDDMCHFRLGMMYMLGRHVPVNEEIALEYLSLSHYKEAYFYKGLLLENKKEYALAFESFLEGSQYYQVNCLYKVGCALKNGIGVTLDLKEAYRYFQYGYYLMRGECAYELALMCLDGLVCKKDVMKAIDYLEEAEAMNCFEACYLLAQLYESGKYVKKDLKKAIVYYKKARDIESYTMESFEENDENI